MGWSPLSQRRQASVGTPTPTSCMIQAQRFSHQTVPFSTLAKLTHST